MRYDVPASEYAAIEELIASGDSPVGIDAKKTHVLILHKLMSIERRLERLETAAGEPLTMTPSSEPEAVTEG